MCAHIFHVDTFLSASPDQRGQAKKVPRSVASLRGRRGTASCSGSPSWPVPPSHPPALPLAGRPKGDLPRWRRVGSPARINAYFLASLLSSPRRKSIRSLWANHSKIRHDSPTDTCLFLFPHGVFLNGQTFPFAHWGSRTVTPPSLKSSGITSCCVWKEAQSWGPAPVFVHPPGARLTACVQGLRTRSVSQGSRWAPAGPFPRCQAFSGC